MKQIKMKEYGGGGGGAWIWPHWIVLSSRACKYELQVIFCFEAALLHYIGRFFEESIFSYIG